MSNDDMHVDGVSLSSWISRCLPLTEFDLFRVKQGGEGSSAFTHNVGNSGNGGRDGKDFKSDSGGGEDFKSESGGGLTLFIAMGGSVTPTS